MVPVLQVEDWGHNPFTLPQWHVAKAQQCIWRRECMACSQAVRKPSLEGNNPCSAFPGFIRDICGTIKKIAFQRWSWRSNWQNRVWPVQQPAFGWKVRLMLLAV